ncbi:MAG: hypothetical protein RL108_1897 [Bacteroidota bacterium]|jgi:hypothetical protein
MEDFNEFMRGEDYSQKTTKFNTGIEKFHKEYMGSFDTNETYFILIPSNFEGKIELKFDQKRNIPDDLKRDVLKIFHEIWK